jgi:hypothetical protein
MLPYASKPTPTAAIIAIDTPTAKPNNTFTPERSPSTTHAPIPTSSLRNHSANSEADNCRTVVDGFYAMRKDLGLPEHFQYGNPFRQATDFNPNQYFKILPHLHMKPGYELDYVYFKDELGGKPLLYARKTDRAPFQTYKEFLKSYDETISYEGSYSQLKHDLDYLEKIQVDGSPESYFQYVILAVMGDQFYLLWHGNYNDTRILCNFDDIKNVEEEIQCFDMAFPKDVVDRIEEIDFSPAVLIDGKTATVRFVTFTIMWGGFFENIYKLDMLNPGKLMDIKRNPLIMYNSGLAF